jgi:hypothetical protein
MPEPDVTLPYQRRSRFSVLIAALSLMLVVLVAACPVGVVAVQNRVVAPPSFALRFGSTEIAAPCPTRVFICPQPMPWYAIWQSEERLDGSITFRQLFFMYLAPVKRP